MDFHRDSVFSDIHYIFCYKMLCQGLLAHAYNPQTGEIGTEGSRVPGDLMPSSGFHGYCTSGVLTYRQTSRIKSEHHITHICSVP